VFDEGRLVADGTPVDAVAAYRGLMA
jgi:hypothetical protein